MVKVGPKLSPPTRRELDRQEKELRRAAQLAAGVDPNLLGEPREHLAFLLSQSKKARFKRPDLAFFEQSRRKWEKNQKRAQARRLAKRLGRNVISEGSEPCGESHKPHLPVKDDGPDDTASFRTTRTALLEAPISYLNSREPLHGILIFPPKYSSALEPSSLSSEPLSGNTASLPWTMGRFHHEEYSNLISFACPPLAPKLDIEMTAVYAARNEKSIPSRSSSNSNTVDGINDVETNPKGAAVIQPIKKSPDPRRPGFSSRAPPSRLSSVRSSRNLVHSAATSAHLSLTQDRRSSTKSFVFSEPLDLSRYSVKSCSTRSSQAGHFPETRQYPDIFSSNKSSQVGFSPRAYQHISKSSSTASSQMDAPHVYQYATRGSCSTSPLYVGLPHQIYQYPARQPINERVHGPANFLGSSLSSGVRLDLTPDIDSLSGLRALPEIPQPAVYDDRLFLGVAQARCLSPKLRLPARDLNSSIRSVDLSRDLDAAYSSEPEMVNDIFETDVMDVDDLFQNVTKPRRSSHVMYPFDSATYQGVSVQEKFLIDNEPDKKNASASLGKLTRRKVNDVCPPFSAHAINNAVTITAGNNPSYARAFANQTLTFGTLAPPVQIIQEKKTPRNQNTTQEGCVEKMEQSNQKKNIMGSPSPAQIPTSDPLPLAHFDVIVSPPTNFDTPLGLSQSGIVPPASTPNSTSPLVFPMTLPSPPWSRQFILPMHAEGIGRSEAGRASSFVLALKWMFKKIGYFLQRKG